MNCFLHRMLKTEKLVNIELCILYEWVNYKTIENDAYYLTDDLLFMIQSFFIILMIIIFLFLTFFYRQLKPDPSHKKYRTAIKWKNLNPEFNEEFVFEVRRNELPKKLLDIRVYDKDVGRSDDFIGKYTCLLLFC